MEIIQIVGLGLLVTILSLVLKEQKPMFAFLITTSAALFIFIFLVDKIAAVIRVIEDLALETNVNMVYLKTILKIIGIAYIAELGAQIVRDSGHASIASKIELAGKVLILVMAIPIIEVLIKTVLSMLPSSA
ncbi:stage III sporulation protein AD [Insulibacter thermoxylanivorax]|uniref:Stage III sporulation protein AD n=1 Tax=Insulibacter thermoxylanivorax TaxID=2749268 RepID=A0A916Q9P7_9BACL|nr:stage III sporulation protein AD [Insulibacter thermoxylanivorax]GFR36775.1 stage III sporulation protein AD [Insulibacter thermoxylanivorax]